MKSSIIICVLLAFAATTGFSQTYDLTKALKDGTLVTEPKNEARVIDEKKHSIAFKRVIWLKDASFSEGTIEIDLKGTETFQGAFLGIAFHGVDTLTYDGVYFRPFNFRAEDPVRKIHAVQYISEPAHPWHVTRKEMNGIYEKAVTPAPTATEWFHAKIVVKGKTINVYVNDSKTPSLTVDKLNDRNTGKIGLWCDISKDDVGEFANLKISK